MTNIQAWLDQGRDLADQATDGPWEARSSEVTMNDRSEWKIGKYNRPQVLRSVMRGADAEFIADARTRLPQALDKIQAVLDLHHKVTRYGDDECSISEEEYLESPEDYGCLEPFDVCAECLQVEWDLAVEQSDYPMSVGLRSSWPCPTAKAIDPTLGGRR